MNRNHPIRLLSLLIVILSACSPARSNPVVAPPLTAPAAGTAASPTVLPAPTLPPTLAPSPTALPSPTPAATLTPTPPVFDPASIVDIAALDGYVLTEQNQTSTKKGNTAPEETSSKSIAEYDRQSAYYYIRRVWRDKTAPNGQEGEIYWVGHQIFAQSTGADGWYFSIDSARASRDIVAFARDQVAFTQLASLKSAHFTGQQAVQGMPASHFTFDQADIDPKAYPTGTVIQQAQGSFDLAQPGNYPLHFDEKITTISPDKSTVTTQVTKDLSSINQAKKITLPADLPQLNLPKVPLPADAELYTGTASKTSADYEYASAQSVVDVVAFYKALPPSSGWSSTAMAAGSAQFIFLRNGSTVYLVSVGPEPALGITKILFHPYPQQFLPPS